MPPTHRVAPGPGPLIALEPTSDIPLYEQLYHALRAAIVDGGLRGGMRLPATRALAGDLGISRNTVSQAYDQLYSEGYLERRLRGGTFVARVLPDHLLRPRRPTPRDAALVEPAPAARPLSARGAALVSLSLPSAR